MPPGEAPGPVWRLRAPVRQVATRFAAVACPPRVRLADRTQRVLAEFELLLAALPPASRHGLAAAFLAFDRGARLYPRSRGRRFVHLADGEADAYLRALLARGDGVADVTRKLKSAIVMCYYELPDVQEELGYRPGPYIAAVTRRRLASYAAEIRQAEAAALTPAPPEAPQAAGPGHPAAPGEGTPPGRSEGDR